MPGILLNPHSKVLNSVIRDEDQISLKHLSTSLSMYWQHHNFSKPCSRICLQLLIKVNFSYRQPSILIHGRQEWSQFRASFETLFFGSCLQWMLFFEMPFSECSSIVVVLTFWNGTSRRNRADYKSCYAPGASNWSNDQGVECKFMISQKTHLWIRVVIRLKWHVDHVSYMINVRYKALSLVIEKHYAQQMTWWTMEELICNSCIDWKLCSKLFQYP